MARNIRWGRAVVAGLLAEAIGFPVAFVLYSSVNGLYARYGDLPYAKPMESVPVYLLLMVLGGIVLNVLWALVYAFIQEGLPGQKRWQKGLSFALIMLIINVLPIAFNTWMQIAQPEPLILVEAANRTIGLLITGQVIAVFYGRPDVKGQPRQAPVG